MIGNDYAGTELKFKLKRFLDDYGYKIVNFGTDSDTPVDYPDKVYPLVQYLIKEKTDLGILICGSAQVVSITTNKYKNIRAAVCWKSEIA